MRPNYQPPFLAYVKKQNRPFQLAIEDVVEDVCSNPFIGETKTGDLRGIRIHKFRYQRQQFLIAYRLSEAASSDRQPRWQWIDFYQIGPHENFYSNLKQYLKS